MTIQRQLLALGPPALPALGVRTRYHHFTATCTSKRVGPFSASTPPNPNCRTSHAHSNGSEHRALQHTARSPPAAETAPVRRAVCGPRGPACPPVARTVHPPGVSTRRGARRPGRGAWRAAWSHVARNGWWETGGATGVFIKTWEE